MEPLYKDRDWLYEQYVTLNKTQKEISIVAKCAYCTIRYWIKKFEIQKLYSNKEFLRHNYCIKKLTQKEIAEKCGCSAALISMYIRKYKLQHTHDFLKTLRNETRLKELYVHQKLSTTQIATLLKCGTTTVRRYLKYHDIQIRQNKSKHHMWYNGGNIATVCAQCNRSLKIKKSNLKLHNFCNGCYGKWSSVNRILDKAPAWKGGKSFEPYPPTFNKQFKQLIRERDNYTCICGEEGKNVHHIDYIKENTIPENCITLCKVCHGKTNFNREHWQEILTNIMTERNSINE